MEIRKKLGLSFGVPVFLILAIGILFTIITQSSLQNEIGESALRLTRKTITEIDKGIFYRVEGIQVYSASVSLAKVADISNNDFDKIFDVNRYINIIDNDWKEKEETPLIRKYLDNELSSALSKYLEFYKQKDSYAVIAEMYVTNKYGVVIGSTGRTSDFLQADEEWYQNAVKEKDFWVGDVEYDESSDTLSVDIVVNLFNDDGDFAGIVKGVLNVEDIRNTIYQIQSESQYKSMAINIVNKNGLLIFNAVNPLLKERGKDVILDEFGEDISCRENVGRAIKGEHGFGIVTEGGRELFSSFAHSKGFRSFKGLGWSLIIDYETNDIFSHVFKFRNIIATVFVISFIAAIFLSIINTQSISTPIIELKNASIKIGSGKLDTRIDITTQDEIGQLGVSFNKMAENLKKTTVSKNYVDNIFRSMTDTLIVINPDTTIKTVNQAVFNFLGYKEEKLIGKLIGKILVKEKNDLFIESGIEDLIKKGFIKDVEMKLLTKDCRKIPVLFSGSVMCDNAGKAQGIVCVAKDISDRKKLEEFLASEKEYLNVTLQSIGDGVITTDSNGNVVILNKVAQELSGWAQDEASGKPLTEIFHIIDEKSRLIKENPVEKVLKDRATVLLGNSIVLIAKDGTERPIADSAAPIFDNESNIIGVVLVFRDISERNQFEKEKQDIQVKMLATSKLSSLGEVATGVAHEINQPLTYISSFIQGLILDLKAETIDIDHLKEGSEVSLKQINRINNIIQHLRTFGRREDVLNKQISIKTVLDNTLLLMGERIRLKNIELFENIETGLPMVSGNSNQLEQVFINLFQNSIDVFENKSKDSRICVDVFLSENKESVIIKVKDNGKGIGSGTLAKIFDPFFTTKEVGKGTGLGLSIIYGIVREHNGTISCESEINKGTTFTIMLPVSGRN